MNYVSYLNSLNRSSSCFLVRVGLTSGELFLELRMDSSATMARANCRFTSFIFHRPARLPKYTLKYFNLGLYFQDSFVTYFIWTLSGFSQSFSKKTLSNSWILEYELQTELIVKPNCNKRFLRHRSTEFWSFKKAIFFIIIFQ